MFKQTRLSALSAFLLVVATAKAGPLDWTTSQAQLSAISQLGAGYAWAQICDMKINTDVAARFIDQHIGHQLSAKQVADMMLVVVGTIGLERHLVGSTACAQVRKDYGRNGSGPLAGLLF